MSQSCTPWSTLVRTRTDQAGRSVLVHHPAPAPGQRHSFRQPHDATSGSGGTLLNAYSDTRRRRAVAVPHRPYLAGRSADPTCAAITDVDLPDGAAEDNFDILLDASCTPLSNKSSSTGCVERSIGTVNSVAPPPPGPFSHESSVTREHSPPSSRKTVYWVDIDERWQGTSVQ